MASRLTGLLGWGLATTLGCGGELPPTGQVRLFVDTDAMVPAAPDDLTSTDGPSPLFDTLIVDVYEPDADAPCEGCTRAFAVDEGQLRAAEVSFGIPAEPGVDGYVVRLRLYSASATLTGEVPGPTEQGPPPSVIDRWVSLPVVSAAGVVDVNVRLGTEQVGLPVGTRSDPVQAERGPIASSAVGTWPGAAGVPCAGVAAEGEVCVPGGAFWMGHPRAIGTGIGDAWNRPRLVQLAPFFLDQQEVTVAQWRAFDPTGGPEATAWSGASSGDALLDYCTFTVDPGPRDALPMACVTVEGARAYCQSRGKDLPTEAQLEYVAGGLESRLFVWGSDEPACDDAVLRRYGYGIFLDLGLAGCLPETPPGGAEVVGGLLAPPRRDRLSLPGGAIYDLVGNVSEWALDRWNRQSEPCWSVGGVYVDPVCLQDSPLDGSFPVFRLGSFAVGSRQAIAAARSFIDSQVAKNGNGIDLGFRCARPGI